MTRHGQTRDGRNGRAGSGRLATGWPSGHSTSADHYTGPTDDPMVFGAAGGYSIALSEMPDRVPPPCPMISFMVTGIHELVASLKARGASFQPPDAASFAGVKGKAFGDVMDFGQAKSAFLKDPAGNVIALNEFTG